MNNNRTTLTQAVQQAIAENKARRKQSESSQAVCMRLTPVLGEVGAYELMIYGDIGDSWWGESVTAQSVVQQLNELSESVSRINVRINSYGGSVADGLAIYNALRRHSAEKYVTVDGVAMSAASLIAMAGDVVVMPPASILMIHAPWGGIYGNAAELREYADVLDKFSEAMADAYVLKSGWERDDIVALLTDGVDHYWTGTEAVDAGFADRVEEPDEEADASAALAQDVLEPFAARLGERLKNAPGRYAELALCAARGNPAPTAEQNPPATAAATTTPADAGHCKEESTMSDEQKKELVKAALAADKKRRGDIAARFAPFANREDLDQVALATLQRECENDDEMTPEAASAKLLDFLGRNITPIAGGHRVEITRDETATYREGAIAAVLNRKDPGHNPLDDKSKGFRGMNLLDLGRDCLERAGKRTRGMSRPELAVQALQSTSDFPFILENVITKTLRQGYEATSRTFRPWTRQATLPDFKEVSRVQISGAPDLKSVLEGAEYEFGVMTDGAEKYRVQKYGRIVSITWETIINDDLNALTTIPMAFGTSAGDLESDIVYGIINGNPNMADGVALFHGTHGNLGTAGALIDAISMDPEVADPIAEMREKMLLQKGLEGRYITVRPRYLLVPPALESAALKVTNAAIVASRASDANVIGPSLTPIVEPRLQDGSATAWYGAAEPTTVDTIEYAYLEGHEGVFTETRAGFEVDGMQVKCRHVFGAKAIDHKGLFKNAGAAPSPFPGTGA